MRVLGVFVFIMMLVVGAVARMARLPIHYAYLAMIVPILYVADIKQVMCFRVV